MKSNILNLFIVAFLLIASSSLAQFDYSKKLYGITLKTGLSNSINDDVGSSSTPNSYLSASAGVYRYFTVNSKNESLIPFHYLKIELNFGSRTGLFTINDLNQKAAVRTNFTELVVIAPLTWEISDHVAANIGIGGSIGFVRSQTVYSDIKPTPTVKEGNSVKGSIILDYHLLFIGSSNALVGSRVLIEPSQYSYFEWSIYIGFALPRFKNFKKTKTS